MRNLVDGIRKHDNRLTAGDVGYRYLLKALADGGRSDVIFDMNCRSDRPGYGYIINTGTTALTEGWAGNDSQDHFMLGHIMEWFYGDLAGIQCDPESVAFKKIVIHPSPVGNVTWAKASYHSIRGLIASSWKREGQHFTIDVTIPRARPPASVYPPRAASVREGGSPANQAAGVRFVRETSGKRCTPLIPGRMSFNPPCRRRN